MGKTEDGRLIPIHTPHSSIDNCEHASAFRLPSSIFEIGSARNDELDAMLRVMCEAFELPYGVARPIFYSDPYFDPANKRVLRVEGQVVSCLTVTQGDYRVGAGIVKMAGITGVATLPAYRRHGYAARLLTATLAALEAQGFDLVGLFPFDFDYYRRLGWETAGAGTHYAIAPTSLPTYQEAATVRPAVIKDLEEMASLYAGSMGMQTLRAIRNAKRWQYVHDRVQGKQVFVGQDGHVEGYVLYELQPGTLKMGTTEAEFPPVLRVLELCAGTETARRGLVGHLAAQVQVGRIEYSAGWHDLQAAGLLDLPYLTGSAVPLANMQVTPSLMVRVINFTRLLTSLKANWHDFNGSLTLHLTDSLHPEGAVAVVIMGNGIGLPTIRNSQCKRYNFNDSSTINYQPSTIVKGDVRAWSQVVVGHIGGEDACALGLLVASSPEAGCLVGRLFPPRAPFLPAPDHF